MDLDGDGINDILSGSWPGEIFFFKGLGGAQFADRVKLKDKSGKTINIGGGIQRSDENEVLIAGDATFETKDGKQYIVYEGEWIDMTGKGGGITGTASAVHAHDLDSDGDLDLLVGDIGGNVYLVPNEGAAREWAFGTHQPLRAGDAPIRVQGDAGPYVADWDGDKRADLLVGSGDGSVQLFRNAGTDPQTKLPIYAAPRALVAPARTPRYDEGAAAEPTPGVRTKVCTADWNGDGRLDLLVGDFATLKPSRPDPTPQEQAEHDKVRAQIRELEPRYRELSQQLFNPPQGQKLSAAEREKLTKDFSEISNQMHELRSQLPPAYENHGWVWLYLRKQADHARAGG